MTNTQIVKSMYEAFSRGDIPALLNSVADNVDWVCPGPASIPQSGRYHGPSEVAGFFQKVAEATEFDEFKALYGATLVCGFADIHGTTVGILANNGIRSQGSEIKIGAS